MDKVKYVFYNNMPNYIININTKEVFKFVNGYMDINCYQLKKVGFLKSVNLSLTSPLYGASITKDLKWEF